MNQSLHNLETIREYLLGRILDEKTLEGIEELLFTDDDFCQKAEIIEDDLINDFVLDKLSGKDLTDFEKTLENNSDRRTKIQVTQALNTKFAEKSVEENISFFESIKVFFRNPIYAGAFAVLLVALLIGAILIFRPSTNSELAELKNIYKDNRPFETRLSEFDYAPYTVTRGEEDLSDAKKRKLRIIENDLLKKVDGNPIAVNHNSLGIFYLSQKKYAEAVKELEAAVKLAPDNAQLQNDLGSAYFEQGKNTEKEKKFLILSQANERFSKAIELNPNFLPALFNKSLYLQESQLFGEAKKSWELYLNKDSSSKWADEARKNLEKIEQLRSNVRKTKEDVLTDLLNAYRSRDEKQIWKIHNATKGTLANVSLAEQLSKRFLEARQNKDDPTAKESIAALNYIGKLEKEKHADFFFADLAEFYAKVEDSKIPELLKAKNLMWEAFSNLRESSKATAKFSESEAIYEKNGNEVESDLAELWSSQMLIYGSKLNESADKMEALLEKAKMRKHLVIAANLYYWVGICKYRQGEFSHAIAKVQKAFELSSETDNSYEKTHSAESLIEVYTKFGNTQKALNLIYQALVDDNIYYTNASQNRRNLRTIISLLFAAGNNLSAVDFASEAIEISKIINDVGGVEESLPYLTDALKRNKNFDKALESSNFTIESAIKLEQNDNNKKILADAYLTRADLRREMNLCDDALSDYQKSLEFYEANREVSYNSYNIKKGRLLCLKQLNRMTEFTAELEELIKLSEENRSKIKEDKFRQAYFENEQTVFDLAVENALPDKEKAFNLGEIAKSRSLLDFVRAKEKSIAEVEQDFGNISTPFSVEEIQARMPENVEIIEYAVLPKKIAVWQISKNKFELTEKSIEKEQLEQQISEYLNLVKGKNDSEALRDLSRKLYQLLIPNNLEKGKILCLIPDKSLFQIPFASLMSPDGKYLIEDFALLHSPSSSVFVTLTENAKSKPKEERLLSVGNPKFDSEINPNLADLSDAEAEAKEITKNYPDSRRFVGEEATKKSFLAEISNAGVIHFAGHFVVNEQSFENSRMLFADADLLAVEFSDMKLPKAKLAVLSACQTGLEKLNQSEGAIGIYRTFLAVGTPLVLASGWKVDSTATKDLMIIFHQKRRMGNLTSVEALRQAQLEMLKKQEFSSPNYWSAFSLTGGLTNY